MAGKKSIRRARRDPPVHAQPGCTIVKRERVRMPSNKLRSIEIEQICTFLLHSDHLVFAYDTEVFNGPSDFNILGDFPSNFAALSHMPCHSFHICTLIHSTYQHGEFIFAKLF
jgi:hypothetical protein